MTMPLALSIVPLVVTLAHAEVVDRVIAVVQDRVVTSSDVRFEQALQGHAPSPLPLPAPTDDAGWAQRVVDHAILRARASDTALFQPKEAEVTERVDAFYASFPPGEAEAFLTRWGLDDAGLRRALRQRAVVEKYVRHNLSARAGGGTPAPALVEAWLAEQRQIVPHRLL